MKSYEEYRTLVSNKLLEVKTARNKFIDGEVEKLLQTIEETLDDDINNVNPDNRPFIYVTVSTYDRDVSDRLLAELMLLGFKPSCTSERYNSKLVYYVKVMVSVKE